MLPEALARAARRIDARLAAALQALPPSRVRDAMEYALQGGKKLRGFLVLESAALHGLPADTAIHAAAAIEAIHAYSLIHDDLPSMDDDDLRRGRPTVHLAYDEATAILAGDALQTLAFGLLAAPGSAPTLDRSLLLVARLAEASGAGGMVLGQAQDIAAETAASPLDLDAIIALQAGKTGALIRWSAEAGAILAGADPAPMTRYATALGLAFQVADDILDVEGEAEKAGKRLRKDEGRHKATFVALMGLAGAKARARELVEEACAALAPFGAAADTLCATAHYVVSRDN